MRQSDRFALYDAAAERLKAIGPALCLPTRPPDELERRRKRQLARGLPPVYDRAALSLTAEERAALEAEGRRPHWRFRLDHRTVAWADLVRGDGACRLRLALRPGAGARRRQLSLHAALGRRRHRARHHARHPRRGPRHQHRPCRSRSSRRSARRRAGLRAPQPADHGERRGAVEAPRPPVAAAACARPGSSRWRSPRSPCSSARPRRCGRSRRSTSSRASSTSRISRARRRSSTRPSSTRSTRRLVHDLPYDAVARAAAALGVGGGEAFWLAVRGNLDELADAAALVGASSPGRSRR